MALTTVSARDFARDLASAKKAANSGPVIVTDRGRPAYALLKIEDYYKLTVTHDTSLLAAMDAIPGGDFTFEPPQLTGNDLKPADLN
jgi:PHD/YefM family antitoxin component YafN of YafNO toxin-antitoxin module